MVDLSMAMLVITRYNQMASHVKLASHIPLQWSFLELPDPPHRPAEYDSSIPSKPRSHQVISHLKTHQNRLYKKNRRIFSCWRKPSSSLTNPQIMVKHMLNYRNIMSFSPKIQGFTRDGKNLPSPASPALGRATRGAGSEELRTPREDLRMAGRPIAMNGLQIFADDGDFPCMEMKSYPLVN